MAEKKTKPARKGCIHYAGLLLLVLLSLGMGTAFYFLFQPQDLSDLKVSTTGGGPRDLTAVFRKSLEKGHSVTVEQEELNRWLAETLQCRQGGVLSEWVVVKGVSVRMEDGYVEVIQDREIMKRRFTQSLFLRIDETEVDGKMKKSVGMNAGPLFDGTPYPRRGGRYGKLTIPEGFLLFSLPSFKKLASVFDTELELAVQEMGSVEMKKGRIILTPFQIIDEKHGPGPGSLRR